MYAKTDACQSIGSVQHTSIILYAFLWVITFIGFQVARNVKILCRLLLYIDNT